MSSLFLILEQAKQIYTLA